MAEQTDWLAPDKTYSIIVADMPWKFSSNSKAKPGRNAMRHYDCMTDDEISELPIAELSKKDSLLFMWTTSPMLRRSIFIPEKWGFRYVSSFVWVKSRIASGYWVRNRHEPVLLYRRGKFPRPEAKAPFGDSVINFPTREHSRKPPTLIDEITRIWPDEPKLEMFSRETPDGWDVFGNQTGKFDDAKTDQ